MTVLETFSGKLRFHDGTIVDSVLTISDDTLTVTADTIEVGTWPMKYCRASRVGDSEFELNIDGESTWFHPVDPYAFGKAAADRFVGSSIADRINVIRSMPLERMIEVSEPEIPSRPLEQPAIRPDVGPRRHDLRTATLITLAVVVAVGAIAVGFRLAQTEEEPVVVTTQPTVVENEAPALFMSTPAGFQDRWNAEVLDLDNARLLITGRLGSGRFSTTLSDQVRVIGDVAADGTIDSLTLTITPTLDSSETEFALVAMGTAIAIADPTLSGPDRQRLLLELGLDYQADPMRLEDINGRVTLNDVTYRLHFFDLAGEDGDELQFTISETP